MIVQAITQYGDGSPTRVEFMPDPGGADNPPILGKNPAARIEINIIDPITVAFFKTGTSYRVSFN